MKPKRKASRLSWAAAGIVALLLAGVTIAFVSYRGADKVGELDKTGKLATQDTGSVAAPVLGISQQAVTAPDDSEIATTTDASGVKTETRTFKSHPHIARVVVTTDGNNRQAQVYSHSNEARELPEARIANALEATGDSLAIAVGFVSFDEKGKGVVAKQKGPPPVKQSSTKPAPGPKTISSNAPPLNQTGTDPSIPSQSTENKQTQTSDNPKQRYSKPLEKKGEPQGRAKF